MTTRGNYIVFLINSITTLSISVHNDLFRACEALCQCLPDQLKDDTFDECLKTDKSTKHWLSVLLKNLDGMISVGTSQGLGGGNTVPGGQAKPLILELPTLPSGL